ncbi:G-protein coupled receptor Mth2-like isoform X1 [Schistocerca gregaria]|uniref:G-protein coupled receptor Mth2-like isoform X1 n=1 Tax=Schistocerca gregaria TaxID=7010 RepID=UPI00211E8432|nr:G-protein coupled receptor Mth2-like isoform X1 [Schistocerca gregaria]
MEARWRVLLISLLACSAVAQDVESVYTQPPEGLLIEPITVCPFNDTWPCVPKCCHMGYSLAKSSEGCQPSDLPFDPIFAGGIDVGPNCLNCNLIVGEPCPNKFALDVDEDYRLFANGTLQLWDGERLGPDDFCVDAYWSPERALAVALPLICFSPEDGVSAGEHTIRYVLYPIGKSAGLLVSVPFLVATAWVYLWFPELRDLHGKSLASHALCLAVAYVALSITQLAGDRIVTGACIGFAFLIQFSFLASFSWLTILALDTTWHVMSVKNSRQYPREDADQRRVFVGYSVFAWFFPLLCLVITLLADIRPSVPPSFLKPNLGTSSCWFSSKDAALNYFYGPIGFLFMMNIGMFALSIYRICTYPPVFRNRSPTERVRMILTLFVSMGISWTMELVSWALGGPVYAWALPDIINILQGVILFVIFVLEPSVKQIVFAGAGGDVSNGRPLMPRSLDSSRLQPV